MVRHGGHVVPHTHVVDVLHHIVVVVVVGDVFVVFLVFRLLHQPAHAELDSF